MGYTNHGHWMDMLIFAKDMQQAVVCNIYSAKF